MPILLQSSDKINKKKAEEYNVEFIHKHSKSLLQKVRKYFDGTLGFGDFEFRPKDRAVIMSMPESIHEVEQYFK